MAAANDRCLLRRTTLLICLKLSYFESDYDQISEHRRDDILTTTWLAINSNNFEYTLLCNERLVMTSHREVTTSHQQRMLTPPAKYFYDAIN